VTDEQRATLVNFGFMNEDGMPAQLQKWVVLGEPTVPTSPPFDENASY
jgi:hypothetical protein